MTEPDTSFAAAYLKAQRIKAEREAAMREALEAAARAEWSAPIYDPIPYSDAIPDPRFYDGTGIGLLYELLGEEYEGWQILPGSNRP